jgi:hypothetical protein
MPTKLGLEGKLYRNTGTYASPTWVEMTNVRDVTGTLTKSLTDVTTRANDGWRAQAGTLKEKELSFQMVHDPADAAYLALRTAFFASTDTPIEIAWADGPIATTGTTYIRASMIVSSFSRSEGLEDAMITDVTMVVARSSNAPSAVTVP